MRSIWKGIFFKNKSYLHKSSILINYTWKKKFKVHTGRSSIFFFIDQNMLGLRVGSFIFTRKVKVLHKKKLNKKKLNKKK